MTPTTGKSKFRTLRPWLITALAFAAVIGLVMWRAAPASAPSSDGRPGRGGKPGAALPKANALTVGVARVEQGDLALHFNALGTVTAFNTVNVKPRVNGELVKVLFQEGQEVKAGDLLAVVDPRTYKAALAQAEGTLMQNQAQLKNAEIDLQRYKGLYAEDSIAKQTLDTQEAQVRQLQGTIRTNQGQVDDARLNLTFTEVRAPISGRLGLRQVDIGNLVTSGDTTPLVVITQVKPISVVFSLPQQQIGTVVEQMNGPGKLTVTALDRNQDKVLAEGTLTTLDNQIDTTTGTVKLKARFENADGKLFPNQFVNVRLLAQTLKGVLTIPANAVQRGTNGIYVYVVGADNKVSQRSVAIGTSENERVVVESGLKAGEQVVVEGTDRLRDGMEVRVAEASPQVLEGEPQKPQTGRPSGLQGDSVGSGSAE